VAALRALRGRRLLRLTIGADQRLTRIGALLESTRGRLPDVIEGPDGLVYGATCNRDGGGSPAPDDDRILRVRP